MLRVLLIAVSVLAAMSASKAEDGVAAAPPANWSLSMNLVPDNAVAQCSMRFPTSDTQPTFRLSNRVGKDDGPLSKGAAVLSITAIDDQLLDGDETKIKGAKVKFGNAWTSGDVDAFWRKGDKPGGSSISLTISPDVEGPLQYLQQADSALAIIPTRDGPKLLQVAFGAASRAGAAFEACLKG